MKMKLLTVSIRPVILLLIVVTFTACGPMFGPKMDSIEGSVWYRERIAPPPDAVVRVTLEDVSRKDVKGEVLVETSFRPQGGPPWAFTLTYDPQSINPQGRYALRAELRSGGKLMFASIEPIPA